MQKLNPERIKEKKDIRLTANCVGGAFLLGTGLSLFIQIALIAVLFIMGKSQLIEDDGVFWMIQFFVSTLMFTFPFIVLCKPMHTSSAECCDFRKPKKGATLPLLLLGFAVCMLANLLGGMLTAIFDSAGISVEQTELVTDPARGAFFPVMAILCGAVLPALIEEFALRGIVLGAFKRFGAGFAIIASALFFSVMHGNLTQIPFTFIFGLYAGFITVKGGSIWIAVILHFFNNAFAFLLEIIMKAFDLPLILVNAGYMFLMFLLGFVGIGLMKDSELLHLSPDQPSNLKLHEKLWAVLGAPTVVIFLAYTAFNIVLMTFMGG